MPELAHWTCYAAVMAITFAASFTQGCTGFGSALITMPLMSLIVDFKTCVAFSMLQAMTISSVLVFQMWRNIRLRRILPLSAGAVFGALTGLFFLKQLDASLLRLGLGVLLISFSCFSLLCRPRQYHIPPAWGLFPGFLTGAASTACSAGGPPTLVYAAITDWDKEEIKSTLVGFFFLNSIVVVTGHVLTGITTARVFGLYALCLLPLMSGIFLGVRLYGKIKTAAYRKVLLFFLLAMGLLMAWPV